MATDLLPQDDTDQADDVPGTRLRLELRIMEKCAKLLDQLAEDPRAKARVMDWLYAVYGRQPWDATEGE